MTASVGLFPGITAAIPAVAPTAAASPSGQPNAPTGDHVGVVAFSAALALALDQENRSDTAVPSGESTDGSGIGMMGRETEIAVGFGEQSPNDSSGGDGGEMHILPVEPFMPMEIGVSIDGPASWTEAAITAALANDPLLSVATLKHGVTLTTGELMRLASTDRSSTRRELSGVAPELRDRLGRIIDRMRSEFGYDVQVVETVRSQERQDALFAQGRTRPGPVVTWTRDSKHIDGRAADVMIDGGYDNAAAFQILGRVAREEGLRTLGPRDPGHLELPGPATSTVVTASSEGVLPKGIVAPTIERREHITTRREQMARTATAGMPPLVMPAAPDVVQPSVMPQAVAPPTTLPSASAPNVVSLEAGRHGALIAPTAPPAPGAAMPMRPENAMAMTAGVARVATVARVASVARVARTADVARVSAAEPAPVVDGGRMLDSAVSGMVARQSAGNDARSSDGGSSSGREERQAAVVEAAGSLTRRADADALIAGFGREATPGGMSSSVDGGLIDGIAHADASERIARLLKVQDAAAERPLTQLMLRVDAPDGTQDRIRIDLRGSVVGATFDMNDAGAAERLSAHVGELQHALERQGLEAESLSVRTVTRATESGVSHALAVSAEREGTRATASSTFGSGAQQQGGRESRAFTRPDDSRQGSDHRHRSRREQKGEQ